jgi:hypothetical protein
MLSDTATNACRGKLSLLHSPKNARAPCQPCRGSQIVELFEQKMELRDGNDRWLLFPLACAPDPHQLHGILANFNEFPSHGAASIFCPCSRLTLLFPVRVQMNTDFRFLGMHSK